MSQSFRLCAPALVLSGFSFLLFAIDAFRSKNLRTSSQVSFWTAIAGLLAAGALLPCRGFDTAILYGKGMLVADGLSVFMSWIAILSTFLVVLLSDQDEAHAGPSSAVYFGMLLLSATGLLMAASSYDFLMIFLAIEMVGIPAFILTGFNRNSQKSGEAAIKFFLIGAFSSAMLAFGISLLYGLVGSTSLSALQQSMPALQERSTIALLAFFFIIVSFGFKIALVPFHMWVPDAFEGAPTPIAAYLSVAPKMVGVALAVRVFNMALPEIPLGLFHLLSILAALTMTIANVIGLQQRNVVRLLAYSSIAHMGYVLLGVVAGGTSGLLSIYIYGWIYLFMNLGAFAIVICLSRVQHSSDLSAYEGLAKRSPILSALLVLFLVSLAGLPPTAGFVAKFYVFAAIYEAGRLPLLLIAAVNSVIAVGYYFKILHAMYFKEPNFQGDIRLPLSTRFVLAVTSFVTLFWGLAPQAGVAHLKKFIQQPPAQQAVSETPQP